MHIQLLALSCSSTVFIASYRFVNKSEISSHFLFSNQHSWQAENDVLNVNLWNLAEKTSQVGEIVQPSLTVLE